MCAGGLRLQSPVFSFLASPPLSPSFHSSSPPLLCLCCDFMQTLLSVFSNHSTKKSCCRCKKITGAWRLGTLLSEVKFLDLLITALTLLHSVSSSLHLLNLEYRAQLGFLLQFVPGRERFRNCVFYEVLHRWTVLAAPKRTWRILHYNVLYTLRLAINSGSWWCLVTSKWSIWQNHEDFMLLFVLSQSVCSLKRFLTVVAWEPAIF